MRISYFDDYGSMSQRAADLLLTALKAKKDLLVCAATGGSPRGLYERLAENYLKTPHLFENLSILKLDEWGGIPLTDPHSCHSYLQEQVIKPLKISPDRYVAFNSEAENVENECARIQQEIDRLGPIDICILGLGKNGHLGLNEPADFLQRDCHIAQLSTLTMQHEMVQSMAQNPTYGLTLGMTGILQSKKIILLIAGTNKENDIKSLLTQQITTQMPASFLWLHGNVECLIVSNNTLT